MGLHKFNPASSFHASRTFPRVFFDGPTSCPRITVNPSYLKDALRRPRLIAGASGSAVFERRRLQRIYILGFERMGKWLVREFRYVNERGGEENRTSGTI